MVVSIKFYDTQDIEKVINLLNDNGIKCEVENKQAEEKTELVSLKIPISDEIY